MEQHAREIQLEGGELKEMQALTSAVETDLLKLADHVLVTLYGKAHGIRIKSVHVNPNNTKIMIYDEKLHLIGVWEKPPGVCRGPRKGEK